MLQPYHNVMNVINKMFVTLTKQKHVCHTKCIVDPFLQEICLSIAMKLIIIAAAFGIISTFGWQWMNRIAIMISGVAILRNVINFFSLVSTL